METQKIDKRSKEYRELKKNEPPTPEALQPFTHLFANAIPLKYVRFQQPVPGRNNKEPVGEFRISSTDIKYVVEFIGWTTEGVVWKSNGEFNFTPLANVMYCRFAV